MKECKLNVHALAKIHARVKSDLLETRRTRFHFENIYDRVIQYFPYEEIENFDEAVPIEIHAGSRYTAFRIFWKTISVLSGILSLIVLFSELTLPVKQNVSPFGLLIWAVRGDYGSLQFFGCICVFYLCLCSFFGLFSLRLGKVYSLHADKHSEEYSLLFNANFLIRLIFPLGLNFLHMIRVYDTDYQDALSSMDIVGFYEQIAEVFFPILVVLFSSVTYCNVIGKILRALQISNFDPQVSKSVDIEIAEGQDLIKRERRNRKKLGKHSGVASATPNVRPAQPSLNLVQVALHQQVGSFKQLCFI